MKAFKEPSFWDTTKNYENTNLFFLLIQLSKMHTAERVDLFQTSLACHIETSHLIKPGWTGFPPHLSMMLDILQKTYFNFLLKKTWVWKLDLRLFQAKRVSPPHLSMMLDILQKTYFQFLPEKKNLSLKVGRFS